MLICFGTLAAGSKQISFCSIACVFSDTLIFPRASSRTVWPLNDTTAAELHFITGACKAREVIWDTIYFKQVVATPIRDLVPVESIKATKKTSLIHGDISYNFSNHSSPDTSFVGNSFVQHQVTVNLYATISKKYPVIFHFSTLQTSIPYVHNYVDFSIQFDSRQFKTSMIDQYMSQIKSKITASENRDSIIRSEVIRNFNQQQDLSKWLTGDKQMQQLMSSRNTMEQYAGYNNRAVMENLAENEAKHELSGKDSAALKAVSDLEKIKNEANSANLQQALRSKLSAEEKDSTGTPSLQELTKAEKFISEYSKKLNAYRSAGQRKDSLALLYDSLKRYSDKEKDSLEKMIKDGKAVELAKEYGDSLKNRPVMKFLLGIQKLALGNSFI
ncbi:MAG TPA: hypothetical protein VHQ04_04860, partial [Puia sp.]|nr:hypothetical protein [Puia sp.]